MTGAALVTVALMLAVYGVVGGNDAGWTSTRTLGILATAVVLLVAFVVREARVENPLVPLRLFSLRNVVVSQIVGVLWAGSMFACCSCRRCTCRACWATAPSRSDSPTCRLAP